MSRNLVLCCDGTANEFARDHTNVLKLYSVLDHAPGRQRAFYHPGLGTMEPDGALTTAARQVTRLLGKAVGYGLADDIRDAYVFLMREYEDGDRLFLFGFSRGAYTVRAVASLLHMYGLIRSGNEPLVPYAIRMMLAIHRASDRGAVSEPARQRYFDLARQFNETMSRGPCAPHFVGVWDTVSSVGWVENPLKLPYIANNPDIAIGRHAIAIDERRAFFRTNLWRPPKDPARPHGPKDLRQVWFPGVHCDVGGGYPEAESGLAKIALEWMIGEAVAAGLAVLPDKVELILGRTPGSPYARPDPDAVAHESLTGLWHAAEFLPKRRYDSATGRHERRMNRHRRRRLPPGSLVHESAFQRGGNYAARLPADAVRVPR
jgi:uncharacterized protein (DUF2235 family)